MAKRGAKSKKKPATPERGRAVKAVGRAAAVGAFGTRERTSRAVTGLLIVVAVLAWFIAKGPLIDRARIARHNTLQVDFNWPDLLAHEDSALEREWLAEKVFAHVTVNPFDQESLEQARASLMATGWFRDINAIRRGPALGDDQRATIMVEGDWRRPEAMVIHNGRKYLVDRDGYVIERPIGSMLGEMAYMIVDPPGSFQGIGQRWGHEAVAQAVRVLAEVDRKIDRGRYGGQIRGVDYSGGAGPGTIVLMTDTGSRVVWGSPLGEEVPVTEPGADEKLTRMTQVLRDYGRVDANAPLLDLRRSPLVVPRTSMGR
jgi:hypothetical protein